MAEEEEVVMELEALQAIYIDDCVFLDLYPPHLHLHIKPRTADVSSEQFVEAIISIRAGPKGFWYIRIFTRFHANTGDDKHGAVDGKIGNCPVCRKVFHSKYIEHVLDLVGSQSDQPSSDGTEVDEEDDKLLHSDLENIRRQQENSGLIEPKRDLVVLPGMFVPQPATLRTPTLSKEMAEQEQREPTLSQKQIAAVPQIGLVVPNTGIQGGGSIV